MRHCISFEALSISVAVGTSQYLYNIKYYRNIQSSQWHVRQYQNPGSSGGARHGWSVDPHRETYWSRIMRWIVRNFQILIASAVKICIGPTMSAICFSFLPGLRPWTPLGLPSPMPAGLHPQMKVPGTATAGKRIMKHEMGAKSKCATKKQPFNPFSPAFLWL